MEWMTFTKFMHFKSYECNSLFQYKHGGLKEYSSKELVSKVFLSLFFNGNTVFTLLFPLRDYYFNLIKKAGLLERRVYWRGGIIFSMP